MIKNNIIQWVTQLLVRFGRIKSAPVEISEIELILNNGMPEKFKIAVVGGESELEILNVNLSVYSVKENGMKQRLKAILFCNFKIKMNDSIIFNTHLNIDVNVDPDYSVNNKSIGVKNAELINISLINDNDSFIKDVSNLANGILPTPLKGLFNIALASSTAILGEGVVSDMTRYLSIYNSGNKQKIIDYHHSDIENKIVELSNDSEIRYLMDESEFEEKLFADYGKKIKLEAGKLYFYFE